MSILRLMFKTLPYISVGFISLYDDILHNKIFRYVYKGALLFIRRTCLLEGRFRNIN